MMGTGQDNWITVRDGSLLTMAVIEGKKVMVVFISMNDAFKIQD